MHSDLSQTAAAAAASHEESERYRRGLEQLNALDGRAVEKLNAQLGDLAPDLIGLTVAFAYGDVYADKRLDPLSRQVSTVAALAALGNCRSQLSFHINASLNLGMSPEAVIEVIYVAMVFAGFPAGINAVAAAREVFESHGVRVTPPKPPTGDRRARGEAALRATSRSTGADVLDSLRDIAPDLADFILDFSYGDVFCRETISPQWKEIAMISAAGARGTMAPQLKIHLHAALNVGCLQEELAEVIKQLAVYAGFPASLNAAAALGAVLDERND